VATAARLDALVAEVHVVCARAQVLAPTDGGTVPAGPDGRLLDVHRELARAATLVAQSAQSVMLVVVALRSEQAAQALIAAEGAERAAARAGELVARARALIEAVDPTDPP
jgi:hypothetical protein